MRYTALLTVLMVLAIGGMASAAEQAKAAKAVTPSAPTVLSIVPAQGEPGTRVSIFGSGFGSSASVFLGTQEIAATVGEGGRLTFDLPALDAGLYALYVKRGDGAVGRVYNFTVLPLRPQLASLAPDRINGCSQGGQREVTARGRNFTEQSMLLLDGAIIPSRTVSPEEIVFSLPQVPGGQHQVVVKNGQSDEGTLPRALTVETRPEISQVSIGSEYVNYYELHIYGINFHQNSSIYVDGQRIGGRGGEITGERDRLTYVDCTKLIYQRYPYSSVKKEFKISVMNPGGENSQSVTVSAP